MKLSRRRLLGSAALTGAALTLPRLRAHAAGAAANDLLAKSTVEIARMLREGSVSCVELVNMCYARIDEVNPKINAVVAMCRERALAEAAEADAMRAREARLKGRLHGVPFTVKDSFDTAGVVSTGGTLGRKDYVPGKDATVVARVRAAGAILLGKTNTPEFTLGGGGTRHRQPRLRPHEESRTTLTINRAARPAAPAPSSRRAAPTSTSAPTTAARFAAPRSPTASRASSPRSAACRAPDTSSATAVRSIRSRRPVRSRAASKTSRCSCRSCRGPTTGTRRWRRCRSAIRRKVDLQEAARRVLHHQRPRWIPTREIQATREKVRRATSKPRLQGHRRQAAEDEGARRRRARSSAAPTAASTCAAC